MTELVVRDGHALVPVVDTSAFATAQQEAAADAAAIVGVVVDSADAYTQADALLTAFVQKRDFAVGQRQSATKPLYGVIKTVESWFRPWVGDLDTCIAHLKGQLANYRVHQAHAAALAREEAARALETGGTPDALLGALNAAQDATTKPAGRAGVVFRWVVERVIDAMVPREWWCVDRARLDALAAETKGDEPPVVPGVVFRREATVRASRKGAT